MSRLLNIIILLPYIIIVSINYFSVICIFKEKNNSILLTNLNFEYMKTEIINKIVNDGRKQYKILNISFILLSIPMLLVKFDKCIGFSFLLILVYLFLSSLLLNKYIKKLRGYKNEMYAINNIDYNDNDKYYNAFGYKNPNDKRLFVKDPIQGGNYLLNKGIKKGKLISGIFYMFVAILLLLSLGLGLLPVNYEIEKIDNGIKVGTLIYHDKIYKNDIESIKLLQNIPHGKIIKVNGASTEDYAYGTFKITGVGKVRLYVYENINAVVEVKRKNKLPVYINNKEYKSTEKLYEKIINMLK